MLAYNLFYGTYKLLIGFTIHLLPRRMVSIPGWETLCRWFLNKCPKPPTFALENVFPLYTSTAQSKSAGTWNTCFWKIWISKNHPKSSKTKTNSSKIIPNHLGIFPKQKKQHPKNHPNSTRSLPPFPFPTRRIRLFRARQWQNWKRPRSRLSWGSLKFQLTGS